MTHERANPSADPAWTAEPEPAPRPERPETEAPPRGQGWSPTAWRAGTTREDER